VGDDRLDASGRRPVRSCAACGQELRAAARFCDACGAAVVAAATVGERKQVTVLFGDVVGSMKLAAVLDPERLQELMNDLFNASAAIVQRYGGTVDKFTGDGLMALFGAPVALEDHAKRACIAALEIQAAAVRMAAEVRRRDGIELQMRVGLNSGEVVAGEIGRGPGRYTAVGHPVGMAQRMESAAPPGGVLCSASTARLVEGVAELGPAESVAVKGETDPIPAHRLRSVAVQELVIGRDEGPMLGRDAELSRLIDLFDSGSTCAVGVVGQPGIGKSRLVREYAARVTAEDADVVVARCDAHTSQVPLRALSRMLRAMFDVGRLDPAAARAQVIRQLPSPATDDVDATPILFDLLGIADPDGPSVELTLDARHHRLVTAMTSATELRSRRTIFILEDVHWIDAASEATLADFTATLAALGSTFVTTYRPEYRGSLCGEAEATITLDALTEEATTAIALGLIGDDPTVGGIAARIAGAAAGNAFFVEEMVRDLVDRGVLVGSRGSYRREGDIDEITVPPTVQSVVAARIDRLAPQAKSVLNAAAVIGSNFDLDIMQALLPFADRADLADLVSVELIDQIEFVPRDRYCFRHALVRKVAYEAQLNSTRVHAHRRLASAIHDLRPSAVEENAALIAGHLESAGDLATAHGWHMRAAKWLQSRDMVAARSSWAQARSIADRLPDDQPGIVEMRVEPRAQLLWTDWLVGTDPDSDTCFEELRTLATQSGDTLSLAMGAAGRAFALCENEHRPADASALADEVLQMIDEVHCDAMLKVDLLYAVMWAKFLVADYAAILRTGERIRDLAATNVNSSVARANTVCGVTLLVWGDVEAGQRELALGIEQARGLDPVTYSTAMTLKCGLTALGLAAPDETTLSDARAALKRAEALGDNFAQAAALWACGTVSLRSDRRSAKTAVGYLERARDIIVKHGVLAVALAPIEADLAVERAREGQPDEAIKTLRRLLHRQMTHSDTTFFTVSTSAFVQLLADRGRAEDIAEATMLVQAMEQQAERVPVAAYRLGVAFCRLVLDTAAGDNAAALANYQDVVGQAGAHGEFLPLRTNFATYGM
jgi:adenylate cyclase